MFVPLLLLLLLLLLLRGQRLRRRSLVQALSRILTQHSALHLQPVLMLRGILLRQHVLQLLRRCPCHPRTAGLLQLGLLSLFDESRHQLRIRFQYRQDLLLLFGRLRRPQRLLQLLQSLILHGVGDVSQAGSNSSSQWEETGQEEKGESGMAGVPSQWVGTGQEEKGESGVAGVPSQWEGTGQEEKGESGVTGVPSQWEGTGQEEKGESGMAGVPSQ
jgi:hypothetical protein